MGKILDFIKTLAINEDALNNREEIKIDKELKELRSISQEGINDLEEKLNSNGTGSSKLKTHYKVSPDVSSNNQIQQKQGQNQEEQEIE